MTGSPFLRSIEDFMRVRRYSRRTIKSYLYWIKYFIVFNEKQHPIELGNKHIVGFLTHLAVDRHEANSTRYPAIGLIGNRLHALVYTRIRNGIRVIRLRKANRREAKLYEHKT